MVLLALAPTPVAHSLEPPLFSVLSALLFGLHVLREGSLAANRPESPIANIPGTFAGSPFGSDGTPETVIRKGKDKKTFLITAKKGEQVGARPRWNGIQMTFVGAAMVIGTIFDTARMGRKVNQFRPRAKPN
jgi:hypothetical protein